MRDEAKDQKMVLFGQALPKIRKRVEKDLSLPNLPRKKVLATIVELLDRTFIRIGNEEYAKQNKSFGLTTLRNRHVDVEGITVRFQFRGKSGVKHEKELVDRRVAKIIRKLQDLPGQELFQYLDDNGERRSVTSQDVNDYLKEITGDDFSAKDFRTWAGTVLACLALKTQQGFTTRKEAKAKVKDAISAVAHILGNTPSVCRKCYIHPAVLESYFDVTLIEALKQQTAETLLEKIDDLREEEIAVLKFLSGLGCRRTATRKPRDPPPMMITSRRLGEAVRSPRLIIPIYTQICPSAGVKPRLVRAAEALDGRFGSARGRSSKTPDPSFIARWLAPTIYATRIRRHYKRPERTRIKKISKISPIPPDG